MRDDDLREKICSKAILFYGNAMSKDDWIKIYISEFKDGVPVTGVPVFFGKAEYCFDHNLKSKFL